MICAIFGMDPHPVLTTPLRYGYTSPKSAYTNGEGKYNVGMITLFTAQIKVAPPLFLLFEMGDVGGGLNA